MPKVKQIKLISLLSGFQERGVQSGVMNLAAKPRYIKSLFDFMAGGKK